MWNYGLMIAVLAEPPGGMPTVDGVLDVVSRFELPGPTPQHSLVLDRPAREFMPLAERLLPTDLLKREDFLVSVEVLRPLIDLCYKTKGSGEVLIEYLPSGKHTVSYAKSINWADAVRSFYSCSICKADGCRTCLLVPLDFLLGVPRIEEGTI